MNEKFTPAPWQVFRKESSVGCKEGQGIAELWRDGDERKANAALISAAPEMYAMLDKMLNSEQPASDFYEEADALLAKARGEV